MSPYKFTVVHPASIGLGPAYSIHLRDTDELLGYVRRVLLPTSPGDNWLVYDGYGKHVATSDQRTTAANYLKRAADREQP